MLLTGSAPAFNPDSFSFTVNEDATSVGALTATDADNDIYDYSLSGPGSELFSVDSSGVIAVANMLDYETAGSYSLTATVSDMEGNSDTATVTITVNDVDERPYFSPNFYEFSADEAQAGLSVGAVTAFDPENETLIYSLSDFDNFTIDSATGENYMSI